MRKVREKNIPNTAKVFKYIEVVTNFIAGGKNLEPFVKDFQKG